MKNTINAMKKLNKAIQNTSKAFSGMTFPLIRRISAQTMPNQLVSVQPMSMPTGKIFYMNLNFKPLLEKDFYVLEKYIESLGDIVKSFQIKTQLAEDNIWEVTLFDDVTDDLKRTIFQFKHGFGYYLKLNNYEIKALIRCKIKCLNSNKEITYTYHLK